MEFGEARKEQKQAGSSNRTGSTERKMRKANVMEEKEYKRRERMEE